jgi:O-antigen/teichoic acid export membrane protein
VSSIPNRWRLRAGELLASRQSSALGGRLASTTWVVGDQAIVSLTSFLASVLVGRVAGRYELGVYGLGVFLFWLVASIPNALIWTPYTARAAHLPPKRRAMFAGSVTLHIFLLAAAISTAIILAGPLPIPRLREADWFAPMCMALAPFTFMMLLREHVRRITLADLRFRELMSIDAPVAAAQLGLLAALAAVGQLTATTALLAGAAAGGTALLWLARERRNLRFSAGRAALHWKHNQRTGRWFLCVSLLWLVGDSSYRLLVGELHGIEALGRFTAAISVILCVNPLLLTLTNVAQAALARCYAVGGIDALRRSTLRGTLQVAVVAGIVFLCIAAVGGPAVAWIFGNEFAGLGSVVAALCLGTFARAVAIPVESAMVALGRGRVMTAAAAVRLTIIIGTGWPLVAWRGMEGAGYAMAVSSAASAGLQWWSLVGRPNNAHSTTVRCERQVNLAPCTEASHADC